MSKKPTLTDIPGLGPKLEEKLREAGVKTVAKLSKSNPEKLAAKVDGLSEAKAATLVKAALKLAPPPKTEEKPKKKAPPKKAAEKKPAKPKAVKKAPKKKAEEPKVAKKAPKKKDLTVEKKPKKKVPKKKAPKKKPKKPVRDIPKRDTLIDQRLLRIAKEKRRRQPKFRHEQAHRWIRVSDSWRKVRGIDSATREKRKGRITMVSSGYRKPKAVRGLHPSRFIEVHVSRPADLEGLDPEIHAIRIGGSVGMRKRQDIIKKADSMLLRVLNPGAPEAVDEADLFTDLDDLEVD
jgi:large subunit ribosomal protein L32e